MIQHYPRSTAYLHFLILAGISTARQCYTPDGTEATDMPCSDAETIHCCDQNSLCLSNGYCLTMYPDSYGVARGSCTDSKWGSECPQNCIDPTYNNVAGGEAVVFLKTVDGDNYYCCGTPLLGDNTAECFYNQSSFTLGDGQLMFGYAGLEDATRTSSAGSSSATATSSASTTNISPTSATMTATTTTLSQSDAAAQTGGPQCQGDTGNMKVGVGVGVPLGVTALLAVAWALWERRKRLSTKPTVAAPDRDFTQLSPSPARYYYEMMGQVGQAEPVQHVTGTMAELHDQARPFEVTDVMETSPYKPNLNQ